MLKINTVTMEEKIVEILFKTILTNTEINQCTKELLNLFSVMNKELAFCECKPNTDIYTESVTKCNKCNKQVTTLRIK